MHSGRMALRVSAESAPRHPVSALLHLREGDPKMRAQFTDPGSERGSPAGNAEGEPSRGGNERGNERGHPANNDARSEGEPSDGESPGASPDRTVTAAEAAILASASKGQNKDDNSKKAPSSRMVKLEDAIRMTGRGKFHHVVLLVSGCLVMASVLETVVVGYLLPSATCELRMSDGDKGLLGAASYAGVVVSSHFWGLIADTKGRRKALLWAMLLTVVSSLASSIAPNFLALLLLRFFCGVFTSAPAALSFAYLGEFHTPQSRSRAIIWVAAFPSIGLIILPGVAWLVLPQDWQLDLGFLSFGPWRLLLVLCALLSLLAGLLLLLLGYESPKFLHTHDPQRALAVLRRMYAWNTGKPDSEYPVDGLLPADAAATAASSDSQRHPDLEKSSSSSLGPAHALRVIWQQTAPLFKTQLVPYTLLVCFIQFGNLVSANGLQIWLPEIFNSLAIFEESHPNEAAQICASRAAASARADLAATGDTVCAPVKTQVFVNNIIVGGVSLITPLICGSIVNMVGKRNLLVVCMLITGTFAVCLTVVSSSNAVLGLSSVIVAINAMGISHISSIVVELFPTNVRAMAVSLHLMFGRVGSIVGNLMFGALLRSHCPVAFYTIGGILLGCAVLSCFLPAKGKYAA